MMNRFLLVRSGCPHCREFLKAINTINIKLPFDKKIKIIDCANWENYGLILEPIMEKFEKDGLKEGYPLCFIDGIIIEPSNKDVLKVYINKLLEEDLQVN